MCGATSPAVSSAPVLELRDVSRSFGALRAVDHVSLAVRAGSLTSIIGPNGAGKTTLYNLISGRLRPDSGRILLKGEEILGLPPHAIARRGLARSFQITNVFPGLTAFANVRAAVIARTRASRRWFADVGADASLRGRTDAILEQVGLGAVADRPCRSLSHGDRRVVEIAIILALEPDVILLDEPTAGTNPQETARIVGLIQELQRETGKTFLLTEHDMKVVFSVSERIVVMHQGRILADGAPDAIRGDLSVRQAYLGGVLV
jgi:branched-chain amino acid transport system ATP-binding protein